DGGRWEGRPQAEDGEVQAGRPYPARRVRGAGRHGDHAEVPQRRTQADDPARDQAQRHHGHHRRDAADAALDCNPRDLQAPGHRRTGVGGWRGMSFAVFEGEDQYVVAAAGGIMAGDESVLIKHLRETERTGAVEATVYVKLADKAILEEVVMITHPITATRATGPHYRGGDGGGAVRSYCHL